MFKHLEFPRSLARMTVATGMALTLSPAFAADLPAGTYMVDGAKTALSFDGKGHYRVEDSKKMVVAGKYMIKGNQIQITDKEGAWACAKELSGTYTWTYEKSVLTFTKVTDACGDRVSGMADVKWKRQH